MKNKISVLTISYVVFLVLLLSSAFFSGLVANVVYYLAFILPLVMAIRLSKDSSCDLSNCLTINKQGIKHMMPLIFPTVLVVMLVSFATSLVLYALTGSTNSADVGDSFPLAIISFALIPAILEELLFRYLPMRLIAPYSRRGAVIISAFFFALIHHNFFTIPYAFIAGVIFMSIDIATNSIIPSVIIHFVNNAISVGIILFGDNPYFALSVYAILGILSLISVVVIVKRRSEYKKLLLHSFDKGEGVKITIEMLMFAGLALSLAFVRLI